MKQVIKASALLILGSLVLLTGCIRKSEPNGQLPYTVRGTLENSVSGDVYLSSFNGENFVPADTAPVESDGSFVFRGETSTPDIFRISLSDDNHMLIVIDAPHLEVHADARNLHSSFEVNGSEESGLLQELIREDDAYSAAVSDLEKKFIRARDAGHADSLMYFQERFMTLREIHTARKKKFIGNHPESLVASYATWLMAREMAGDVFIDSMTAAFSREIPGSKYVLLLNTLQEETGSSAMGSSAPEIVLPQPDGTPLKLSSLRGSYVLIDFWASWCRPCREENPEMVLIYERYRGDGFEILGVSLDESKSRWTEAIAADKLPWRHVSDLKGANGPAAIAYNVQAIPMTVLVDPEGRIVETNLRGSALRRKLQELFGK